LDLACNSGKKIHKRGKEYKRYKFQIGKGAENSTLEHLANNIINSYFRAKTRYNYIFFIINNKRKKEAE